jgi:hypothetical protein
MTKRLAAVVLTCAALGSLALAGVRIAGANARHPSDYEKHLRIYGTTPALAVKTLASLHVPTGFRDVPCLGNQEPGRACWSKTPSLPLGHGEMWRLMRTMGVHPYSAYEATYHDGFPVVSCMRYHVARKYRLGIQNCRAEALKGNERVLIFATSLVLPSLEPTRRVISASGWRYPTEVEIYVVGHFEHEGIRPGEEER